MRCFAGVNGNVVFNVCSFELHTPEVPMAHLRISRARLRDALVKHFPRAQMTFNAACTGAHLVNKQQGPVYLQFQVFP